MAQVSNDRLWKTFLALLIGLFIVLGACAAWFLPKAIREIAARGPRPSSFRPFEHPSSYAFQLADGRILLVGSQPGTQVATAEFLDPSTLTFSPAPPPLHARSFHPVGTLMKDGSPLLAGGSPRSDSNSILERFDVKAGRWVELDRLPADIRLCDAVCLQDGRILFTTEDGDRQGILVWDPVARTVRNAGHRALCVNGTPLATLLRDGRVLVTHLEYGGEALESSDAFLFDPGTDTTTLLPHMSQHRSQHQSSLMTDGRVLITGGAQGEPSAEIFDPATGRFAPARAMLAPRALHRSITLRDGRVLVAGGVSSHLDHVALPFTPEEAASLPTDEIVRRTKEHFRKHPPKAEPLASEMELFDPKTGSFTAVPTPSTHLVLGDGPRGGLHAELPDGDIIFLDFQGPIFFHPRTLSWSRSKEQP